jgi:hypothetical protein
VTAECLTAIAAWAAAAIAAIGVCVAWRQLSNLNSTLRVTSLTAILQLETDINARKERAIEVAEELREFHSHGQPAVGYQRDLSHLTDKLTVRLENWFNAVDRLAFCILKDYVPEKDWRAEYRQEIADIISSHPELFGPDSRYHNIKDIHARWQRN